MGYNPNYAKKKPEEKSATGWRPRASVTMPVVNRAGKGDLPQSVTNRAAKVDLPQMVNRAAKVDLPKPKAAKSAAPKAKPARPVPTAAAAAPKPKARPAAPAASTFKGNWKGAAPTEMQKRAGARIDRGGGLIGMLKRKMRK
jgi:hypothetical protein